MDDEHLCANKPMELHTRDRHTALIRWVKHEVRDCTAMFQSLPPAIINTLFRKLNEV
jgi:hypothetical protein